MGHFLKRLHIFDINCYFTLFPSLTLFCLLCWAHSTSLIVINCHLAGRDSCLYNDLCNLPRKLLWDLCVIFNAKGSSFSRLSIWLGTFSMGLQSGVLDVMSMVKFHSTNSYHCSFKNKRDFVWISIFQENVSIRNVTLWKDHIRVLHDNLCKEATI